MKKQFIHFDPKYPQEKVKCHEFLSNFQGTQIRREEMEENVQGNYKYMNQLQSIANGRSKKLEIHYEDIEEFFRGGNNDEEIFVKRVLYNTKRYISMFSEVAEMLLPVRSTPQSIEEELENYDQIINQQRIDNIQRNEQNELNPDLNQQQIPSQLKRNFEVYIINGPNAKQKTLPLRQLKSSLLGSLVCVKAIVVRTSDVKPQVTVAAYECDACGFETYQTIHSKLYTPLFDCQSQKCKTNQTRGKLIPNNAVSKFVPYQEIKIQESPEQVPIGNIPRSFNVIAKGEISRQCSPGDSIVIQGVYQPTQFDSFRGQRSLIHDTLIEAYKITREKKKYVDFELSEDMKQRIEELQKTHTNQNDLYTRLAKSIAPEIYGMEDVKKALLLLMVGGSTQEMQDGMRIRGDINVALIGDPGVAKSQLLKHIAQVSPRGIYTTGKGSSGVGLTAAVLRDPISNELCLEGGALVLADMGVCCIDEFDKMEEQDRTAIHEVMEQQTVSIAKAGITTILNARTSILAAANPLYGRYNRKLTPHQNINLPAALLSRFDLVFLLLDKADRVQDERLARHIGYVHQHKKAAKTDFDPLDSQFLRAYIAIAKSYSPTISENLHDFIVQRYCEKRKEYNDNTKAGYAYTTPRTLLGIIRLAQAMARLRFSKSVEQEDIDEALRLMENSQMSVQESMDDEKQKKPQTRSDILSAVYNIILELCKNRQTRSFNDIEKRVLSKGYGQSELNSCIKKYSDLGVLMYNESEKQITLIRQ